MHRPTSVPGAFSRCTSSLVVWGRRGFRGGLLWAAAAAVVAVIIVVAPATLHAQAPTKVFVASFGSDANDGSRGAPKRNFQAAHDAVATDGEIVALDTAGYGAVAIPKASASRRRRASPRSSQ